MELLNLVRMLEDVHIDTSRCLRLLIDMSVHYHFYKMMYEHWYRTWNVRQLLLSHPLVYGVWYPLKYVVTSVCRLFHALFTPVERVHHAFVAGDGVYSKPTVLHMPKSMLGLVLAAKDIQGQIDTHMKNLRYWGPEGRARALLRALSSLLFSYWPASAYWHLGEGMQLQWAWGSFLVLRQVPGIVPGSPH